MIENHHQRHSIRLPGYDYSQPGAYFVTLVTHRRECSLGDISGEEMQLSLAGEAAAVILQGLPNFFRVELDAWVVMPNHVHAILVLPPPEGDTCTCTQVSPLPPLPPIPSGTMHGSLPAIIQNYKSIVARRINAARRSPGTAVWQRNYFEHIIRTRQDYERIWEYIANNPRRWAEDILEPNSPDEGEFF